MTRKLPPIIVYVNTWVTKSTPWLVSNCLPGENRDPEVPPPELLEEVRQAILSLPSIVSIPRAWSPNGVPRYYMIAFDYDSGKVEIIDVIGVKFDGAPTKWSYRAGYWHPSVQHAIARSLQKAIQKARKE